MRVWILRAQIDIATRCADRERGNSHSFDKDEGLACTDHAIGKRTRIALVGVADEIFRGCWRVGRGLPLDAGGEARAAAAAEAGFGDLGDDIFGAHLECVAEAAIAAMRYEVVERNGIDHSDSREREPGLGLEPWNLLGDSTEQTMLAAGEKS